MLPVNKGSCWETETGTNNCFTKRNEYRFRIYNSCIPYRSLHLPSYSFFMSFDSVCLCVEWVKNKASEVCTAQEWNRCIGSAVCGWVHRMKFSPGSDRSMQSLDLQLVVYLSIYITLTTPSTCLFGINSVCSYPLYTSTIFQGHLQVVSIIRIVTPYILM
jgi:hypothetical protein